MIITFIDRLGGALLYPFFALYITSKFSVGMTQVGILFACFSASSFIGVILGGALSDQLGRKGVLIFSLISTSLSAVWMGLVDSLAAFFVLALVVGVFTDVGVPAYQAIVADLLPEEKRAQGFGVQRIAINIAVVIGPAIGGFLASRSYLLLFLADAVISLIAAAVAYLSMPETKPEIQAEQERPNIQATLRGYRSILRDRLFMLFVGACILTVMVYMNIGTTLGVFLRDVHNIPESGYGWILSLNAAIVVLFQFTTTRLTKDRPPMLVMALGTALYAVGFAMYGFVSAYALFLLAMAIITVGEMLVVPTSQAEVARFSPEQMRGRYMAVFGFSWGIPFAIGPLLAGLLMDNADPRWLWYTSGMVGIVAVIGFLVLHQLVNKDSNAV